MYFFVWHHHHQHSSSSGSSLFDVYKNVYIMCTWGNMACRPVECSHQRKEKKIHKCNVINNNNGQSSMDGWIYAPIHHLLMQNIRLCIINNITSSILISNCATTLQTGVQNINTHGNTKWPTISILRVYLYGLWSFCQFKSKSTSPHRRIWHLAW